jgi:hypothetical protein
MLPARVRPLARPAALLPALALLLAACAVTESPPPTSEGSIGAPVLLTVGITHAGSVSGAAGQTESYYAFVAKAGGGVHTISLFNNAQDVAWDLYDNASFSTLLTACDNGTGSVICVTVSLIGGQSYYLKVHNKSSIGTLYYLTVD